MQFAPNVVALDSNAREDDSRLSALIFYENVATGKRAKEVCDILTERLGSGWKIEIDIYSFNSLRLLQTRQIAAASVAQANLVIFSCHDGDLPFEVWAWTELWLARPVRPTALVALRAVARGKATQPRGVEEYLTDLAQRRGMQYFSLPYIPATGTASDHLRTIDRKEPNDDHTCATDTREHYAGGLQTL